MALRGWAPIAGVCAALLLSACGGGEGVAAGATARVYVEAPACPGARRALRAHGPRAGPVRVALVCLEPALRGGHLDLARVGAGARRATEDSAAAAYVESPGPADGFAGPIVEAAEIPVVVEASGARAMEEVLAALERAGTSGSLRESVGEELSG